jgi:hypothetical protein
MQSNYYHGDTSEFQRRVKQLPSAGQPVAPATAAPNPAVGPETSNAPTPTLLVPTNPPAPPK